MRKTITILAIFLGLQASGNVVADDHSEGNWIVDIGEGVAHMAHICTLKNDATMVWVCFEFEWHRLHYSKHHFITF